MNNWFGSSRVSSKKYISNNECSTLKTVGGYIRKNNFKNGYGFTKVDDADRNCASAETVRANTNELGEWTEEREALHSQIIDNAFNNVKKAVGRPLTVFMGGGPASGKSYMVKNMSDELKLPASDERVVADPDECKSSLPEFDEAHPEPVHEESSALAKRITRIGQENDYNVLIDGTGDGRVESMRKKIKQVRDVGHIVNGAYIFKPVEDAIIENFTRGRTVNIKMLVNTHKAISMILPEIAKDFDDVKLYANMKKGVPPVLIATGGGGKGLTIHNQELYDMFINNGEYEYNGARIRKLKMLADAQ